MAYTGDRQRHYENNDSYERGTNTFQPIQYDTQATLVPPPPKHSHGQQQSQAHKEMDMDANDESPQLPKFTTNEIEIQRLMDELDWLNIRATQLTTRKATAETGYTQLTFLKEVEAKQNLDNYKKLSEARFKASQVEIRMLRELTLQQDQHITLLSTRMEKARSELANIGMKTSKDHQNVIMQQEFERCKKEVEKEMANVQTLQNHLGKLEEKNDDLERRRHQTPQQMESISTLRHRMELYGILSGIEITDHKKNDKGDIYSILQSGRKGRISFELTFYQNDNGELIAQYTPLLGASDGLDLPPHMKHRFEFPGSDINVLLWQTATALNKNSDGKN